MLLGVYMTLISKSDVRSSLHQPTAPPCPFHPRSNLP